MNGQKIIGIEYNSAIKKNKIMPFAATWTDIEIAILSDVKSEKDKYHMIALFSGILKKNHTNLKNRSRATDRENKLMIVKVEREDVINWEIGVDIHTLLYIYNR